MFLIILKAEALAPDRLLARGRDELTAEQVETMAVWEEHLRERSEAVSARRAVRVHFFAKFAAAIAQLHKQNLRDVVMSNQAHIARVDAGPNLSWRDRHIVTQLNRQMRYRHGWMDGWIDRHIRTKIDRQTDR